MRAFRAYLLGALSLCVIGFSLTNIIAIRAGTRQPPNAALNGFAADCQQQPQPCWNGIVPGVTMIDTADHILRELGYRLILDDTGALIYQTERSLCTRIWMGANETVVTRIGMPVCQDIRLGHLIGLFGDLDAVTPTGVLFLDGQVVVGLPGIKGDECMQLKPYGRVAQIWLTAETNAAGRSASARLAGWRGYVSFRRYQLLYGIGCAPLPPYRPE